MNQKKNYYISAFILYLNYFIHGIGCSVLGQVAVKETLVSQWGISDIGKVTMVAAALGLGRLIALPFAGPLSDKLGRRIASLIGILSYIIFFLGLAMSPNMTVAYIAAILGGIANSFLDTGVIPACVEILEPRSSMATMLTKFSMSLMRTAYYAEKRPQYLQGMGFEWEVASTLTIYRTLKEDIKQYDVRDLWAYNARYDIGHYRRS